MDVSSTAKNVKQKLQKLYRRIPLKVEYRNPQLDLEEDKNEVIVITIQGATTEVHRGQKKAEDMLIEYGGDKQMGITSRPLVIGGNEIYFTRNGYYGTQAINKDTLLAGDIYKPSKEKKTFELPVDQVDIEDLDVDDEDYEIIEDEGQEFYKIQGNYEIGSVESLMGSKVTLKKMNKGQRIRKLLEPSKLDKQRLILAIGAGVGAGYYLAQYYG